MRLPMIVLLVLAFGSVAHAAPGSTEPRWVPGQGTHNHAPATPRARVRNGAVVGLLGGVGLTVATGLVAGFASRDDVTTLAAVIPAGTLFLPLGASLGTAIAGRETEGKFVAALGWSLPASVLTVGLPAVLGLVLAQDPVGALFGGMVGLVADLCVSPGFAVLGFERSRKTRLTLAPLPGGSRVGFAGRF